MCKRAHQASDSGTTSARAADLCVDEQFDDIAIVVCDSVHKRGPGTLAAEIDVRSCGQYDFDSLRRVTTRGHEQREVTALVRLDHEVWIGLCGAEEQNCLRVLFDSHMDRRGSELVLDAVERRIDHGPTADEALNNLERTLALKQAAKRTLWPPSCLPLAGQIWVCPTRQKGIDR